MENEQKFFVYVDYRKDDGKPFYVGKGTGSRVKDLRRNHLHTNIKNKHGIIREVVFETHNEQESFEKEIQLIGELQTHIDHGNGGANLTLGGEGGSGYKHADEHREKRSELNKKMWEDPEFRAMMKEKMRLGREDPEYREKMRESSKKIWEDPERREKRSELSKKLWEDPERREKLSESLKKLWEDPERREKLSEAQKKRCEDPEVRKKMREILGEPEIKEKISKIVKEKLSDPEVRKKMSENIKLGLAKQTPEQRSERLRLGWETRRLKKLQR
jgi:hypothetical protein